MIEFNIDIYAPKKPPELESVRYVVSSGKRGRNSPLNLK
jgi:hypothetical protein